MNQRRKAKHSKHSALCERVSEMEERFPFFLVRVKTLGVCHSGLVYLFVCHSGLVYLCLLLITAGSLRSTFPASTVKEYLSAEDVSVRDRGQPNHPSETHYTLIYTLHTHIHIRPASLPLLTQHSHTQHPTFSNTPYTLDQPLLAPYALKYTLHTRPVSSAPYVHKYTLRPRPASLGTLRSQIHPKHSTSLFGTLCSQTHTPPTSHPAIAAAAQPLCQSSPQCCVDPCSRRGMPYTGLHNNSKKQSHHPGSSQRPSIMKSWRAVENNSSLIQG